MYCTKTDYATRINTEALCEIFHSHGETCYQQDKLETNAQTTKTKNISSLL